MSKKTPPGGWKPGESGNPKGRVPGVERVRQLLDPHRAERGHEIARIVLKLRGYIEERAQSGDMLLKSAALGLLDGMRPIEQQEKE